ncbi:YhdT family protein [Salibacterium sp. K-3]
MKNEDHRFRIAHKEAWFGVGLVAFNFLWWFGFAYGLGSAEPEEYTYILGMPAWFFYSCALGSVVMIGLVSLVVKRYFKEVPLDDEEGSS